MGISNHDHYADSYDSCVEVTAGHTDALLRCVTRAMVAQHEEMLEAASRLSGHGASTRTGDHGHVEASINDSIFFSRDLFLIFAAALVFFMQAGFAMVCAGAVRRKNLQNTMLKNLLDACGAAVSFFIFGHAFAFGGDETTVDGGFRPINAVIGTSNFFLHGVENHSLWLFHYAFSAAATTIVAGTLAERCQMKAYVYYSIFLSGFVYPVVAHIIWSRSGFLSSLRENPLAGIGVIDFAGGGVVHITGGATAVVATIILGPRRGRFHDDITGEPLEKPQRINGHSYSLQMVGTLILWFGWYGFNAGSALLLHGLSATSSREVAALAAANTTLSGGTAGVVAMLANMIHMDIRKGVAMYDLLPVMNGILTGLVAITAGCGIVEPWVAVLTGFGAGLIYLFGSYMLLQLRMDDAVDGIPVHLGGGIWGMIVVGLLASPGRLEAAYGHGNHPGILYSLGTGTVDAKLLGMQIVGVLFIISWIAIIMWPFFTVLDRAGWLRSLARDELAGLDKSFHGGVIGADGVVPAAFINTLSQEQIDAYHGIVQDTLQTGTIGSKELSPSELDALKQQAAAIIGASKNTSRP